MILIKHKDKYYFVDANDYIGFCESGSVGMIEATSREIEIYRSGFAAGIVEGNRIAK